MNTTTTPHAVCHNMPLQLRQSTLIQIGRSNIHGWGAFTTIPLFKNQFVLEYVGEIISNNEADHRGRKFSSFFFFFFFI